MEASGELVPARGVGLVIAGLLVLALLVVGGGGGTSRWIHRDYASVLCTPLAS